MNLIWIRLTECICSKVALYCESGDVCVVDGRCVSYSAGPCQHVLGDMSPVYVQASVADSVSVTDSIIADLLSQLTPQCQNVTLAHCVDTLSPSVPSLLMLSSLSHSVGKYGLCASSWHHDCYCFFLLADTKINRGPSQLSTGHHFHNSELLPN